MFMYAIGTLSLICLLHNPGHWTQLWYADDVSAGETLLELHDCFAHMVLLLAIFLNLQRVFGVVNKRWKNETTAIFGDLGVQDVIGHRFLGGFIGNHNE